MATKSTKKAPGKGAKKGPPKKGKATPKPAAKAPKAAPATPAPEATPRPRDPRLPRPGALLTRTFQGKEVRVQVLEAGFLYDGKTWRSLSGIAKAVSGTPWNGFLFFGLQGRAKAPANDGEKGGAK